MPKMLTCSNEIVYKIQWNIQFYIDWNKDRKYINLLICILGNLANI